MSGVVVTDLLDLEYCIRHRQIKTDRWPYNQKLQVLNVSGWGCSDFPLWGVCIVPLCLLCLSHTISLKYRSLPLRIWKHFVSNSECGGVSLVRANPDHVILASSGLLLGVP